VLIDGSDSADRPINAGASLGPPGMDVAGAGVTCRGTCTQGMGVTNQHPRGGEPPICLSTTQHCLTWHRRRIARSTTSHYDVAYKDQSITSTHPWSATKASHTVDSHAAGQDQHRARSERRLTRGIMGEPERTINTRVSTLKTHCPPWANLCPRSAPNALNQKTSTTRPTLDRTSRFPTAGRTS
jgi:hypothetical protein